MQLYEHVFDFARNNAQGYPEFYATTKIINDSPDLLGANGLKSLLLERGFTTSQKAYPIQGKTYTNPDVYLMYGLFVDENGDAVMMVNISQDEERYGKYAGTTFVSSTNIKNETVIPITFNYNGQIYEHAFTFETLDENDNPNFFASLKVYTDSEYALGVSGLISLLLERGYNDQSKGYPVSGKFISSITGDVLTIYGVYCRESDFSDHLMCVSLSHDESEYGKYYTTAFKSAPIKNEIINPLYQTN